MGRLDGGVTISSCSTDGDIGGPVGGLDGGPLGGLDGGFDGGPLGGPLGGLDGGPLGGLLGGFDGGPLGGPLGGLDGGLDGGEVVFSSEVCSSTTSFSLDTEPSFWGEVSISSLGLSVIISSFSS